MKTLEFERRIIDTAGTLDGGWPDRIAKLNGFRKSCAADFFWTGTAVARRMGKYDVDLMDSILMMTIYEINNSLQFGYFGLTPDENSDECLNTEYETMLIMSALKSKPKSTFAL